MTAKPARQWIHAELIEDGGVLDLVIDRPKGNVLTMQVIAEIHDELARHRANRALHLVVLRGAGGTFSYGASVEEHRRELAPKMLSAFHELARVLASYPVPVAALVDGRCLGGAFEIVLACHFVFATESARFGCPEIKLGVIPPVLAAIGHLRLGALSERLVLTGREIGAREMEAHGAIEALVPAGQDPRAFVLEWYRETLAPLSTFALREATHAVRDSSGLIAALGAPLDALERSYVARLLPSHDANEGIEAFLAKRAPRWEDA